MRQASRGPGPGPGPALAGGREAGARGDPQQSSSSGGTAARPGRESNAGAPAVSARPAARSAPAARPAPAPRCTPCENTGRTSRALCGVEKPQPARTAPRSRARRLAATPKPDRGRKP